MAQRSLRGILACVLLLTGVLIAPTTTGSTAIVPPRQALSLPSLSGVGQVRGVAWEQRLRRFSFSLLKGFRRWTIRVTRYLRRTAASWILWLVGAVALVIVGGMTSAADHRLLRVWREEGARQAFRYALIGAAVFFRLLADGRVANWTRLVLGAAVLYGIYPRDLSPDELGVVGWLDDAVVVGLASRWFVRRCPDDVVLEQAAYVRARSGGGLASSSST